MHLSEVKALRLQNRFEEAYTLSLADLKKSPENIWAKRSHAWSVYHILKKHIQGGEAQKAQNTYQEYKDLRLGLEERLLHDKMSQLLQVMESGSIESNRLVKEGRFLEAFDHVYLQDKASLDQMGWPLYYFLKTQNKSGGTEHHLLFDSLDKLKSKGKICKALVFKLLIQEIVKVPEEFWNQRACAPYLEYLGLFGQLDEDDYEPKIFGGTKIISLAERLHIAYSKALLRESAPKEKIDWYISNIVEEKLENYSHMQYVPFFKAKLLLGLGEREAGLKVFLPFAQKKKGEFWIWQILAEHHEEQNDLKLAFLSKALSCKTKEEFLCGIKERIIPTLLGLSRFDWARYELDDLVRIRGAKGWGLRSHHREYLQSDWYIQSKPTRQSSEFRSLCEKADRVFAAFEENDQVTVFAVVTHLQPEKQIFGFVDTEGKTGFTKSRTLPRVGDSCELVGRYLGDFFRLRALIKLEEPCEVTEIIKKNQSGILNVVPGKGFGFVGKVYVSQALIRESGAQNQNRVEGIALYDKVPGKKVKSWRMLTMALVDGKV